MKASIFNKQLEISKISIDRKCLNCGVCTVRFHTPVNFYKQKIASRQSFWSLWIIHSVRKIFWEKNKTTFFNIRYSRCKDHFMFTHKFRSQNVLRFLTNSSKWLSESHIISNICIFNQTSKKAPANNNISK